MKLAYFGDAAACAEAQMVVEASRAALSFATALPLGAASDRWGRRPLIALSSICAGAPLACLALAPGRLSLYLAAFVLAGLLGGQFTPAHAAFLDRAPALRP